MAIPVVTYILVLALLGTRGSGQLTALLPSLLTVALVLVAAAAAPVVTLPASIVIMAVLAVLLLAYHLTTAQRHASSLPATPLPASEPGFPAAAGDIPVAGSEP